MNNLKKLIFCSLIVGLPFTEIHTAQELKKRKSERLEQVQQKKMRFIDHNQDSTEYKHLHHIKGLVKNLPILDEGFQLLGKGEQGLAEFLYDHYPAQIGEDTFQNNRKLMRDFPKIIALAEDVIQQDKQMETIFIKTIWDLATRENIDPKTSLTEHENPMIQYINKHSFFMWPAMQKWVNKPNYKKFPNYLLCMAARINHVKMVEILIKEMGADVNVQSAHSKKTPFHYAIQNNNPSIIKILITTPGIDLNLKDSSWYKRPPLHGIIHLTPEHQIAILDIFIQAKADVNSKNEAGESLLHLIAGPHFYNKRILQKLITCPNLNLNIQNNKGKAPLHYACQNSSSQSMTMLINAQADLNIQDSNGDTPLHLTSTFERLHQNLENLLKTGKVDKNIKNKDGNTPLHIAVLQKNRLTTLILLVAGADTTIMNNNFDTAEELATTPEILAEFAQFNQTT